MRLSCFHNLFRKIAFRTVHISRKIWLSIYNSFSYFIFPSSPYHIGRFFKESIIFSHMKYPIQKLSNIEKRIKEKHNQKQNHASKHIEIIAFIYFCWSNSNVMKIFNCSKKTFLWWRICRLPKLICYHVSPLKFLCQYLENGKTMQLNYILHFPWPGMSLGQVLHFSYFLGISFLVVDGI